MITATALPLKLAFRQAWGICMLVEAWATLALALDYAGRCGDAGLELGFDRFPPDSHRRLCHLRAMATLFWTHVWIDGSLHVEGGIVRTLSLVYVYLLAIVALAVLAAAFPRSRGVFRWQAGLLIVGLSLTWLGEGI